jgi:hypothetical protein
VVRDHYFYQKIVRVLLVSPGPLPAGRKNVEPEAAYSLSGGTGIRHPFPRLGASPSGCAGRQAPLGVRDGVKPLFRTARKPLEIQLIVVISTLLVIVARALWPSLASVSPFS